jgi:hypothetical protein
MRKMDEVELLQPWSTFVMHTKLRPEVLEEMLKITDEILSEKQNHTSWGHNLAGQIEDEIYINPTDLIPNVTTYLHEVLRQFILLQLLQSYPYPSPHDIDTHHERKQEILKGGISTELISMWVVSQKDNEYNPIHIHTECSISAVMYLKIPEYLPAKKAHRDDDGAICFIGNSVRDNYFGDSVLSIKPQIGDFFVFASSQRHQVYPFQTKDGKSERRSLSLNANFRR